MKKLIYDRTELDVINAKANPSSEEHLKGNYNYTDLNRLEEWCNYLMLLFNNNGIDLTLNLKIRPYNYNELLNMKYEDLKLTKYIELYIGLWEMTDIPTFNEIKRIRDNIQKIKDKLLTKSILNIVYNNTMDYIQANILEQILYEIDEMFSLYLKSLLKCGTFYCGEHVLR